MADHFENEILRRYLTQAANSMGAIISGNDINIRCNVCGDSKKDPRKMRGHLKLSINPYKPADGEYWTYKCFNEGDCDAAGQGNAWSGAIWLKRYFPQLYTSYQKEVFTNNKNINKKIVETKKEKPKSIPEPYLKDFKPILKADDDIFKIAREYCQKRKIPKKIWKKFFVCTGKSMYRDRLIIPFYDDKKKIYYYQGRALKCQEPKYLNRKSNKEDSIYNLYNIDESKPVMVLEGPIDSMFVENSIATLGLGITPEMKKKIDSLDSYYIFDNDEAGEKYTTQYLKDGKNVFLWKPFLKHYRLPLDTKDINQIIEILNRDEAFTFNELKEFFTKSKYDLMLI